MNKPGDNYVINRKLILAYMFDEIPLHFRRTLDQYYYTNVPTTEARDLDQVVSRYFNKTWPEEANENLLLMVDQLWLWILDEGLHSSFDSPLCNTIWVT